MNNRSKGIYAGMAMLITYSIASPACAFSQAPFMDQKLLLSKELGGIEINKVLSFHWRFTPGQPGAEHQHVGPVFGYVLSGEVLYQVEGEKPRVVQAGEAFYEPAGKKIVHFDNRDNDKELIFVDFNFLKKDQPPVTFDTPPTEKYDFYSILNKELGSLTIDSVVVGRVELKAGEARPEHIHLGPVFGVVAKGEISYSVDGQAAKIVKAGQAFYEPAGKTIRFVNHSSTEGASFINFFALRDGQQIPNIVQQH